MIKKVISFEVFPPNKNYDLYKLFDKIDELKSLRNPCFVSVTYGAGGGTKDKSVEITSKIRNNMNIESLAHLACVNTTKDNIKKLERYKDSIEDTEIICIKYAINQ